MPLSSKISLSVAAAQTATLALGGPGSGSVSKLYETVLADGTLAGQADRMFQGSGTIAASGNVDIDLAGVLTDVFGATITFARIKGLIVRANPANTNNLVVGGAAATQFASWVGAAANTVIVRPGATLALFAGAADLTAYVTAAGSSDLLRLANSGAGSTVAYELILIGASA